MELRTLEFLRRYEQNGKTGDITALIAQFAEVFIVAAPDGASVVRSTEFAKVLPKRKEQFDAMGCRSTELLDVKETPISSRYIMASTKWKMVFNHPAETRIDKEVLVDSSFVIDVGENGSKIILYVPHQDVVKQMQSS